MAAPDDRYSIGIGIAAAPCIVYDTWSIVLGFLPKDFWPAIACVSPSLDDVVVYHAIEAMDDDENCVTSTFVGQVPSRFRGVVWDERGIVLGCGRFRPLDVILSPQTQCARRCAARWGHRVLVPGDDSEAVAALASVLPTWELDIEANATPTQFEPLLARIASALALHTGPLYVTCSRGNATTDELFPLWTAAPIRVRAALLTSFRAPLSHLRWLAVADSDVDNDFAVALARHCRHLTGLDVSGCAAVTDLNCLGQLEELGIEGNCGVHCGGLANLTRIRILNAAGNQFVYSLNHMQQLRELNIAGSSIDDDGIQSLREVVKLGCSRSSLRSLNHFEKLEVLHMGRSRVDNDGIRFLTKVVELDISSHDCRLDLNHMVGLQDLHASGCECLVDGAIAQLRNILRLDASNCPYIRNVNQLTKLEVLDITGDCGIRDDGFASLRSLKTIFRLRKPPPVRQWGCVDAVQSWHPTQPSALSETEHRIARLRPRMVRIFCRQRG